ncbi:hypothetical protein BVY04_03070 [bacterium M21]|nr:hypothetical protein BVY04_03070 [bacterium M21]
MRPKLRHFIFVWLIGMPMYVMQAQENRLESHNSAVTEDAGEFMDPFLDPSMIADIGGEALPIEGEYPLQVYGSVEIEAAYSHQRPEPEWTKLQALVKLNLDYSPTDEQRYFLSWMGFHDFAYDHIGHDQFDRDTLQEYESESEIHEAYVDLTASSSWRIRAGRQIIVWGNSEIDRILDVVTPLDQREMGMKDLGDQRLAATALKLAGYYAPWQIEFVVLPEVRTDRLGTADSAVDPYAPFRGAGVVIQDEEVPGWNAENAEFAMKTSYLFHGGDFSIMAADLFDDAPYLDFTSFDGTNIILTPKHRRISVIGASLNRSSGSWLLKSEFAGKLGKAVHRNDVMAQGLAGSLEVRSWEKKDILHGMVGMEYSGIANLFFALEYVNSTVLDFDDSLAGARSSDAVGVIARHKALRETLETSLTWFHSLVGSDGDLLRLDVEYDLSDIWSIGIGAAMFDAREGDNFLYDYRHSDRAYLSLGAKF